MKFLSLYTPSAPPSGMPSAEHMAAMGEMIQRMSAVGILESTGGIMNRSTGMKVTLNGGNYKVEDGEVAGSSLMPASGYAVLNAPSREALAESLREFLELAGDGRCEIIQIFEGMPE